MTSYLFNNNIWPEFADLLATRPIKIHEFHLKGVRVIIKRGYRDKQNLNRVI